MKYFSAVFLLGLGFSILALTGCCGMGIAAFPDVPASAANLGTIVGNDYGGHSPLIGAHIYLLQASATGYSAQATSLLSSSFDGSSYPTTLNTADPGVPATWFYETSDANGAYNISGDYACTTGYPVYLYGYGGTPTLSALAGGIAVSSISVLLAGTTTSVQFTVTTPEAYVTGEMVQLSGFSGAYAGLNNQSASVLAVGLTTTTFELSGLTGMGSVATGVHAVSGTATPNPTFNPAVANLAMLGVCPASGTFQGTIAYVYMNEVSTVAMAYAMAGFGTDGLHIGTDVITSSALLPAGTVGIQNAATNAANLYDIQGKYISSVYNGEGHIANPTTFAGSNNGMVPQAELDTLGNILAACVDSNNTQTASSPQCTQLLLGASSTGGLPPAYNASNYANNGTALPSCTATSGIGAAATNTAQAAFNIAHFPQTPCVTALYALSTGTVPFTPNLTSTGAGQPNDFSVGITYTNIAAPVGVAMDSYGNAYVPNLTSATASTVTKLSPQGTVLATSSTLGATADSIAIDPSGNVWVGLPGSNLGNQINPVNNQNGNGVLYKLSADLSTVNTISSTLGGPTSVAVDASNNVFVAEYSFFANTNNYAVAEYNGSAISQISVGNSQSPESVSVDSVLGIEYLWVEYDANAFDILGLSGILKGTGTNFSTNFNLAADGNGNAWFGAEGQTNVWKTTALGTTTAYGKGTGNNGQNAFVAGLWQPTWSAVDGSGNVFLINNDGGSSSISELNNSGYAVSCPTCLSQNNTVYGYQKGSVGALASIAPNGHTLYIGFTAFDTAGNLWVPNYTANTVLEVIGIGTPVLTPLALGKAGVAP